MHADETAVTPPRPSGWTRRALLAGSAMALLLAPLRPAPAFAARDPAVQPLPFPDRGITLAWTGPADGGFEGQERDPGAGDGDWRGVDADHHAFAGLVGTRFARLRDVSVAIGQVGEGQGGQDCAVRLPAGRFTIGADILWRSVGTIAWIGRTHPDRRPATEISGGNGQFLLSTPRRAEDLADRYRRSHLFAANLRVGTFSHLEPYLYADHPAHARDGTEPRDFLSAGSAFVHGRGGGIVLHNCHIVGSSINGLGTLVVDYFLKSRYSFLHMYDCEIRLCGTNSLRHNLYLHWLAEFVFVRSTSEQPFGNGHALKLDGEKAVIVDSYVSNVRRDEPLAVPSLGTPVNFTRTQDLWVRRSVIEHRAADGANPRRLFQDTSRRSTWGGFSRKVPPVFAFGDADPRPRFRLGGERATTIGGLLRRASGVGNRSLIVFRMARVGLTGPAVEPDRGARYVVRLTLDDRSIHESGASVGDVRDGLAMLDLDAPLPRRASEFQVVMLRRADEPWDQPELEPTYFNRSHPDYYWTTIRDAHGHLDVVGAQDRIHTRYMADSMLLTGFERGARQVRWLDLDITTTTLYVTGGPTPLASFPRPPVNRPGGATADWPDHPTAGEVELLGFGHAVPGLGRDPEQTDYLHPWSTLLRDLSIRPVRGNRGELTDDVRAYVDQGDFLTSQPWDRNGVLWLAPDGTPRPVPDGGRFLSLEASCEVEGPHAAGTRRVRVTDARGIAPGRRLHLRYPPASGRAQLLSTIVVGVAGDLVELTEPLAVDLSGGEEIAVFEPAGPKPPWWRDEAG
jgi:hypothetical protein